MAAEIVRNEGESQLEFMRRKAASLGLDLGNSKSLVAKTPPPLVRSKIEFPNADRIYPAELIPNVIDTSTDYTQERFEIDQVLGSIDILDAYTRWCGKSVPNPGNKREGILVSCPNPAHTDDDPSFSLNLDKGDGGVGKCFHCEAGYDKYDIAAWHFGFDVPGYKGKEFPELRLRMAEDLGYVAMVRGKDSWLEKVQPQRTDGIATVSGVVEASAQVSDSEEVAAGARVSPALQDQADSSVESVIGLPAAATSLEVPETSWRDLPIMQKDSFLREWMELTCTSYEPEEFYFWLGLMAIGCAIGNDCVYEDTIPVRANFMMCLVGNTGSGKSISMFVLEDLIRQAFPFKPDTGSGVRKISSPGSGESLVDQFNHSTSDLTTGAKTFHPINGLYRESELAGFVKKTARHGSTIREVLMDFYDTRRPVSISSRGAGLATASDHFMQMITSTQPLSVASILSNSDASAGFLNRWIYVFGVQKDRPSRDANVLDVAPVVSYLQDIRAWTGKHRTLRFVSGPAADNWDEFYKTDILPLTRRDDSMTARLPLVAKKILLAFAANDMVEEVQNDHVETLRVLWPYLLNTYGIVGESVGQSELESCMNDIESYIRSKSPNPITARDIKYNSSARRRFSGEMISKALDLLVKISFIEEMPRTRSERVARYQYLEHSQPKLASVSSI